MKQFYYTSCLSGESVSGQSGFQIRALSSPLSSEENSTCMRALNYKVDVPVAFQGPYPIKLLYCRGERTGSIALQSVYLGEDPVTKRAGNYFAHVLCDLDAKINAKTVLEWWKSPCWKCDNSGIETTQLPTPALFPAGEMFQDSLFETMKNDPELLAIWEFLIRSWWLRSASGRIFIAAPQEKLTAALWALCRILPEGIWKQLSFSTYEKDAMLSPAIVVGLWNPFTPQEAVPESCFGGTNAAWNIFTMKKSTLAEVPRYVEFIIQSVKNGKYEEVDRFHSNAPAAVWARRESSEMFFELVRHPDTLDVTRLSEIANLPNIGQFLMKNERRFHLLLENLLNARLLDTWEDAAVQTTFAPFFAAAATLRERFSEGVLSFVKEKIQAGDIVFLERFHTKWLSRLGGFGLSSTNFWNLFNNTPGALTEDVYLWAYPRAFPQVFTLPEPSMQVDFLAKWCFHGEDSHCEPQMTEILRSSLPDIVKELLYKRFFENDFSGNDDNYSDFYVQWPILNMNLLSRLDEENRQRFLQHLLPLCGQSFLEAVAERFLACLKESKTLRPQSFTSGTGSIAELLRLFCQLLAVGSLQVPEMIEDCAKRMSEEQISQVRDVLKQRADVETLIQMKSLRRFFEDGEKGGIMKKIGNLFKK